MSVHSFYSKIDYNLTLRCSPLLNDLSHHLQVMARGLMVTLSVVDMFTAQLSVEIVWKVAMRYEL